MFEQEGENCAGNVTVCENSKLGEFCSWSGSDRVRYVAGVAQIKS
jgi:hypothetical protein